MQLEAVAGQCLADAGDPAQHALFLDPVGSGRIEDAAGIAQLGGGLRAFAGARQHLADAGDLLADLHATDADRYRGRTCADAEDMRGVGLADALGQRHGLRVGPGLQHGEIVFTEAGQLRVLADHVGQQPGKGADQGVGRGQADVRQQACVVVRLDQQQAKLAFAAPGLGHCAFQLQHEGRAIEQAGDLVALAQVLDLARQLGVEPHAAAEHHLQAGLALVGGRGKFHRRRERTAILVARVELVLRRRRLATAEALQQLLEALHVLGRDHVQQRDALDVVEVLVTEHLQVSVVGTDVHAFMHVGDRVARGGDQCVAAALGLAHLRLDPAQAATRLQIDPLVADHGEQVLGALAQGQGTDAVAAGLHQLVLVDALGQQHQWNVLAAGGDVLGGQLQRDALGGRGQHQVDGLAGQHLGQLCRILRAPRAYRNAAVAQGADDGFGVFAAVIDNQQADGDVVRVLHALLPNLQI